MRTILNACEDCFSCVNCERVQCDPRPDCEHRNTCNECWPNGCDTCIDELEEVIA